MKRYLFFLRHFNDTDNIEPVIYFLLKEKPNASATIVYYSIDFDFRDNRNLEFLKHEFGDRVKVDWIGWHLGIDDNFLFRKDQLGWIYRQYNIRTPWRRCLDGITGSARFAFPRQKLLNILNNILYDAGFPSLVIFDQNRSNQVAGLLSGLRELGVKRIISLPVSPLININTMRSPRFGSVDPKKLTEIYDYSGFDLVGLTDRHYVNNVNKTFDLLKVESPFHKKSLELGSLRFCNEWLEIREKRVRVYEKKSEKKKLLFLLSQPTSNSCWHAVTSAIEMLIDFNNFDIVIKPHTRRYVTELGNLPDHIRVENDIESSSLINWADVVLFWGTSMALEAYSKGKTVLCADFMNTNRIVYTEYDAGWILKCLDDLHEALVSISENRTPLGYDQKNIDNMLFQVVMNGSNEPVKNRYLTYIYQNENN